ncbi:DUF5004 domain-containing protein [Rapidithrix thailandica]|uniref:DUF5004 domain-containing protein n=1 Tax=Rapidithrix thailandica TaxID=413964 RepID=A0AAW9RWA9_9BACT
MTTYKYIGICLLLWWGVSACQPDDFPAIGDKVNKIEGIEGDWSVQSVKQIDEIALNDGALNYEMDITDLFDFDDYHISFTSDDEGNPATFEVKGKAPNYVDTEGTWQFDNVEFPTKVMLFTDGATEATSVFYLNRVPSKGFNLELKFQRFEGDIPILSYVYTFTKVQP